MFTTGDGHFLQATFYRVKQHHATTMDRDGVRVKRMKKQTSTHYFSAFTQVSLIPRGIPTRVFLVIFFESLKKKYPGAAFIFFPFRNMIFFFSRLFSFSLSSGEVEEGIFFSAETGEEKRHFIKSCMGEMFEMAFTRAIYSHTYDSQRGKLFSPSVLIF